MKKVNIILISLIILFGFGCEDKYVEIYEANSPIYMSYETLRASVKQSSARDLVKPGKMYFKDDFIFIIENKEGIHVIDNSDKSNPVNLTFIEVPGAIDIAIKGNILYADSYIDLVALNIADLDNVTEVKRLKEVFPYTLPEKSNDFRIAKIEEEKGVVIGWEVKIVKENFEDFFYPVYWESSWADAAFFSLSSSMRGVSGGSTFGVGGSMARFGLYDDYLYTVDDAQMHIFDVSDPLDPSKLNDFNAGWSIETMFINNDKMFLGTQNGMRIYDLATAFAPTYIGQFRHVTSCDPVVVHDTLAYVTLRGGNECGSNVNELDVLSISDITNAKLLKRYVMSGPYGLGIDNNILFVCDGDAGLKVYDATDPMNIDLNIIKEYGSIVAYDVIPLNGVLLLIGEDGFYQYDYSDLENIQLLSTIPVNN